MKKPKYRKPGKTRNPMARSLRDPRFRQRTVRSPKVYDRKRPLEADTSGGE